MEIYKEVNIFVDTRFRGYAMRNNCFVVFRLLAMTDVYCHFPYLFIIPANLPKQEAAIRVLSAVTGKKDEHGHGI